MCVFSPIGGFLKKNEEEEERGRGEERRFYYSGFEPEPDKPDFVNHKTTYKSGLDANRIKQDQTDF